MLRSALTLTVALPGPSVEASIALIELSIARALRVSALALLDPPPAPPEPSVEGHSIAPDESVIVTLSVLRPLTEEAVSCAMPRTAPGPSVSAGLPSMIAAVAGEASSANRSSCGITICTVGLETPSTPRSVLATSPSSARW